ncbi:MAG: peptidyl-prolyl cis-trans isomerase [Phycisphaerae bacterium]|nr:peptidyl-prolyl cis-trans isomerase [Phycisphaerae bacterium]
MKYLIVSLCAVLLAGCTPSSGEQDTQTPPQAETTPAPVAVQPQEQPPVAVAEGVKPVKSPIVTMTTSMGVITIELDAQKAPITVDNFLAYVDSGFYSGTIFHRVIPSFMIQGGGFTPDMQQKATRPPIKNEAANGLKNLRGTIAMARTNVPDSATSQFFINHRDNPALDYRGPQAQLIGYAVFGKVVSGMDVVDRIAAVQTGQAGPHRDVPVTPIFIESVQVVNP